MNLREAAIEPLERYHKAGWTMHSLISSHMGWLTSAGNPSVWVVMGAGYLYLTRDGSQSAKLKAGQIGAAFIYQNGHCEYAIFDVKDLWDEVTGIRAK